MKLFLALIELVPVKNRTHQVEAINFDTSHGHFWWRAKFGHVPDWWGARALRGHRGQFPTSTKPRHDGCQTLWFLEPDSAGRVPSCHERDMFHNPKGMNILSAQPLRVCVCAVYRLSPRWYATPIGFGHVCFHTWCLLLRSSLGHCTQFAVSAETIIYSWKYDSFHGDKF